MDASDYAIGYVLGQLSLTSNLEHVVVYGGRHLKSNEQKWHINEKEGLALKEAILHFKPYLATSKFKVYTDNITVRWLDSIKNTQSRLGRWALELQGYNFEISHRPRKKNPADALSRREYEEQSQNNLPQAQNENMVSALSMNDSNYTAVTFEYPWDDQKQPSLILSVVEDMKNVDPEILQQKSTFRHLQRQCPDYTEIWNFKMNGLVPDDRQKARQLDAKAYHDEILFYITFTVQDPGLYQKDKVSLSN